MIINRLSLSQLARGATMRHASPRFRPLLLAHQHNLDPNQFHHLSTADKPRATANVSSSSSSTLLNPTVNPSAKSIPSPSSPAPLHSKDQSVMSFDLGDDALRVEFKSGDVTSFHYFWLRDNCRCENCFHPFTKQRLFNTLDVPLDIRPSQISLDDNIFAIEWSNGHLTKIPGGFLHKNAYDPPLVNISDNSDNPTFTKKIKHPNKHLWNKYISDSLPKVNYSDLFKNDDDGEESVLDWLEKIDRFGFCLVDEVPHTPEATKKLLEKISFIRETHYGAFWDFTANMEHGDTAYTNLPLGAHTDTTYFSDPAGLQLFHLLSPTSSHSGGKSLLVDGFAAAERLKTENPEAYKILSTLPIDTHASGGEGVAFRPMMPQPIISHHPRTGKIQIIRWNPDDRKPIIARSGIDVKNWYQASRHWEEIINSNEMEFWMQMKMGQALIFDNHRVLHGRSSFTGSRRLCGGYINGDDYHSRLRALRHKFRSTKNDQQLISESTHADQQKFIDLWDDIDE